MHSFVLLSGVVPTPQLHTQRLSGVRTWYGLGHDCNKVIFPVNSLPWVAKTAINTATTAIPIPIFAFDDIDFCLKNIYLANIILYHYPHNVNCLLLHNFVIKSS